MLVSLLFRALLALLVVFTLPMSSSRAEIVYDNSSTGGTSVYYGNSTSQVIEYGDEIVLGGTSRVVSQFAFEYFGDIVAPTGNETGRIRLYKNDGPLTKDLDATPGTLLWDSGEFPVTNDYQTKTFGGLNITVPTDMTWTVQFYGLTGAEKDRAGLLFRDPPSVGSSYDDIWQKTAGSWQLFTWNGSPVANFAARITTGGDPIHVSIRREGKTVVIEWPGLPVLWVADSAKGPFVKQPNIRNRYVFNPESAPMKFWQLTSY